MRTIKFRAWDKKRNEWYGASNGDSLTWRGFGLFGECTMVQGMPLADTPYLDVMQYTGLQDKNGRDIYEGDIVREWYRGPDLTGVSSRNEPIVWHEDTAGFFAGRLSKLTLIDVQRMEVIGNIYENPELLKDAA